MNLLIPAAAGVLILGAIKMGNTSQDTSQADSPQAGSGIPDNFDGFFQKYGNQFSVPWLWLKAIALNESDLGRDPLVANGEVSHDGKSWGLMQLELSTANDYEEVAIQDLNDPDTSVRISAKHFKYIRKSFDVEDPRYVEWCVKAYNEGVTGAQRERDRLRDGTSQPYWERWQRNFERIGGVL